MGAYSKASLVEQERVIAKAYYVSGHWLGLMLANSLDRFIATQIPELLKMVESLHALRFSRSHPLVNLVVF